MEEIKIWCIRIVAVCLCGYLFRGILPNSKTGEAVTTVLRLLILFILLQPLFNLNSVDLQASDFFNYSVEGDICMRDVSNVLSEQTATALKQELKSLVSTIYNGKFDIDIDMDILSDNSIHIKQILVILYEDTEKQAELIDTLKGFCPLCEIVFYEEVKTEDE